MKETKHTNKKQLYTLFCSLMDGNATVEQQKFVANILITINNRGVRYIENGWNYSDAQRKDGLSAGMEKAYDMLMEIL